MVGQAKRKLRDTLIAKALLLGFSIERSSKDEIILRSPNGTYAHHWHHNKATGRSSGPYTRTYKAEWLAAKHALELAGVIDATKPSGDTGAGSGASFRLRGRRRNRRSTSSVPEGSGT